MTPAWISRITDHPTVARLLDQAAPGQVVACQGSWGSSTNMLAGAVARRRGRPVLLVVAHLDDADDALDDLGLFDDLGAQVLGAMEVMPGESHVNVELLADRLAITSSLQQSEQPQVLVASVQALMQAVPESQAMASLMMTVRPGQNLPQQELINWLDRAGYQRVDVVDQPGDFAVRGGIVDVFGPGGQPPIRIDLFGDEVESLAEIDLDSMGSDRHLDTAQIVGASADQIQTEARTTSVWSLLDDQTIVMLSEPLEIAEQARGYYERITDIRGIFSPPAVLQGLSRLATIEVSQFAPTAGTDNAVQLPVRRLPNFSEDVATAMDEVRAWASGRAEDASEPHHLVVTCAKQAERERFEQLLASAPVEATVEAMVGYLHRGFIWTDEGGVDKKPPLMIVPHQELFHRFAQRRKLRRIGATRTGEAFFDVNVGDYVVHVDHGVARFRGLRTMKHRNGSEAEYLTLEFADRALLHVPASDIEQVQKYIGGFAGRPPLSKLGGTRWKKQKEQVREAVAELAKELLRVQAARASMPGIAYPQDSDWMRQFEAEFPYQETEDQLAAMTEIKKDMVDTQPMDRLICGDVGYGKTELAMRGAFKAIESGKQVAVLCPTTVLCEQHERTFRQRMADYPVRIESLSRFKTGAEARRIVDDLAAGRVDLVIGTHRLLSDDVHFADLGMVIVDEEQRFGVEHKNKLMRFRVTVDVLTMSATPIPRTLHMALLGLRDISSLATPPADRRAIVTEVIPYDSQRIRSAILRELNRGGQCYFLHNRVHNIRSVADEVQRLVPEARVIYGHGQMRPRELEEVMLAFLRGEADVLVCTTIIESGIDIPTANTIFINDCDRFGLAELHQLRGRVGRYKHRAYCYLLLPNKRTISEVAARRLRAIEEFSMLGAGFKIAMRDMEIRGVGNLLGSEQSGHIATVGYQMYCRLLEEAAADLKREPAPTPLTTHIELKVSGQLPRAYIASDSRRMEAYRRIHRARDLAELEQVQRDLEAAYGPLPPSAMVLAEMAELRVMLAELQVEALKRHEADLIFTTTQVQRVFEALRDAPGSVRLVDPPDDGKPGTVFYRPPADYLDPPQTLLAVLRKLLRERVGGQRSDSAA